MPQQYCGDDLLERYLFEIRAIPLLSHADEFALGERIARGRDAERALAVLAARGEASADVDLHDRVRHGRAAAEQLFRANLPLVVFLAKRHRRLGIPLLDLIQDGNIGLLRAVERFDHRRGVRFSTYGVWWIRDAIRTGVATNSGAIQLPLRLRDRLATVQAAEDRLMLQLGRIPTHDELATELGMSQQEVKTVSAAPARVRSLGERLGDDDVTSTLGDRVADESPGPEELAATADDLARLLGHLDERERRIVAMRYGLDGRRPATLKEVGKVLGLTGERVRKLELRAMEKLREAAAGA